MYERHGFGAMGTTVRILGPRGHAAFEVACGHIEERFALEEQRFSRFRRDSELSRINAAGGGEVSPPFAAVVRLALDAAASTEGLFDPTVHDALVAAGYADDFDDVLAGARGRLHPAVPCGRWTDVELEDRIIGLPDEVHLDLGGIAKGWTADLAADEAIAVGLPWVLVNAGGDLRIAGRAPDIEIGIEDPEIPEATLVRLRMSDGGLATSSVAKRAWAPGEHHIIDPRTGRPASTDLLQVTAWAPTCVEAEVRATAMIVRGASAEPQLDSVLVAGDGDVSISFEEVAA
jgi:thiamine biosynthesis lipoprotein